MKLEHKNILVLGGKSEINDAVINSLLEEGAQVHFFCSVKSDFVTTSNLTVVEHDFYNFDSNKDIGNQLDGLNWHGVVFAGGKGGVRPIKLNDAEFVQDMFHANVYAFFEWIRLLTKRRSLVEGASVVALSSVSSTKGLKAKTVYSASKAALDAAVRGMAVELADKKIRVNSIQKGWVRSDMNLDFIQSNLSIDEGNDLKKQLLGPIEPQELAHLVTFLLSDLVPSMTGTNIVLDGGYTL
jgi:NAD(P)-dependent dehydrogenase (short-subunit alcohol dehydrogenase family)